MDIYQNSNCLSKFLKQSQVTLKEQNSTIHSQQANWIQIYVRILKYIYFYGILCGMLYYIYISYKRNLHF